MNNEAAPDTIRSRTHSVRQRANSSSTNGANRHDDAVRDFFRRGDRGQYEGGPADRVMESLPALDLPTDRPQIVRTPKQQARRRAMMRVEGVLLAACLALLVTAAARSKSRDASVHQRAVGIQPFSQTTEQSAAKVLKQLEKSQSSPATHAVVLAGPAAISPAMTNGAAALQPLPVPKVAEPSKPIETLPAAKPVDKAGVPVRVQQKPVAVSLARVKPSLAPAKPPRVVEATPQPVVVPRSNAAAPKRAVAAFPDD